MTPIIVGLSGSQVTPDERAALQRVAPAGFILFARNIVDPVQLRALTDDLRDASGRDDLPILTDQEGGGGRAAPAAALAGDAGGRPLRRRL